MANYPNSLDNILTLPPVSGSSEEDVAITALRDAVLAIETELGINPSGVYSDVRSRFDVLETRIINFIGGAFSAGGDLSGSSTSQSVDKIKGNPVAGQTLDITTDGYVLTWNNADGYFHASPVTATSAVLLAGDVSGSSTSNSVDKLKGKNLSSSLSSLGSTNDGYVLTWVNSSSDWEAKPTSSTVTSLSLSGDLSGTAGVGSATVIKLQNRTVSSTAPTDSYALVWNAGTSSWAPAAKVSPTVAINSGIGLSGGGDLSASRTLSVSYGNTSITACVGNDGRLSDSRVPSGSATGDLSGTYPAPTVAKIRGVLVDTTAPTDTQVLTYSASDGYLAYRTPSVSSSLTMTGDVTGTTNSNTVTKLQNRAVSSTAPTDTYALVWNAGANAWQPAAKVSPTISIISGTGLSGGGDLSANRTLTVNYGNTPGTAAQGNDSRLSDSRNPMGPASGDLAGTYPSPTVTQARGLVSAGSTVNVFAATSPTSSGDQALVATNATTATWKSVVLPARQVLSGTGLIGGGDLSADRTLSVSYGLSAGTAAQGNDGRLSDSRNPTGPASGDLSGTYPAPTVAKIQGTLVNSTAPTNGQVLTYSSADGYWKPSSTAAAFVAGGDLTGSATSQTVAKINAATVPTIGTVGNTLYVSSGSALSYGPLNLAGGSNYVVGTLPTSNQAAQSLAGDASGTTAAVQVDVTRGLKTATTTVSVSAATAPSANQALVATGSSAATWQSVVFPSRLVSAGTGLLGGGDLSTDRTLSVSYGSTSTTACVGNDGRLTDSRTPNGSATGDLSGTYPAPNVAKIQGKTLASSLSSVGLPQDGYVLTWINGSSDWEAKPITTVTSLTLTGDVTGTTNSNTVSKINAATVPTIGSVGNLLYVSSGSALSYGALNLAGGVNYVSGVLPTANQASQSLGNDLSGTTASATVIKVQGNAVQSASYGLSQDGYVWTYSNSSSQVKMLPIPTQTATGAASGDLSGTYPAPNVVKIQGKPLASSLNSVGLPQDGYVLTWVNGSSDWEAKPIIATTSLALTGDVTGTTNSNVVAKINGTTISTAGGALTTGKVLRVTGVSTADYGAVDLANSNAVTGTLPVANGGTGITSFSSGIATFLGTATSANLAAAVTDETGAGSLVFGTSPTIKTSLLINNPANTFAYTLTPSAITAARALTIPLLAADDTLVTAAFSQALTNKTIDASLNTLSNVSISSAVSGMGAGVATFLATPTSANFAAALTDETGSTSVVFNTSPTFKTSALFADGSGTALTITPLSAGLTTLQFAAGVTAVTINQLQTSAAGAAMSISAQTSSAGGGGTLALSAGDGATTGGLLTLSPGGGASATGFIRMYDGYTGNNAIEFNPTSVGSASITFVSTATSVTYQHASTSLKDGGGVTLSAQNTTFAGGTGGPLVLNAGTSTGTGSTTGGSVYINTQSGTTNGSVNFRVGASTYFSMLQPNPTGAVDLNFNNAVTAPRILQQSTSTTDGYTLTVAAQSTSKASGIGGQLVLQAGNANGLTSTGGTVLIASGTGLTASGPVIIKTGGTTRFTANATGVITIPNLGTGVVHSDASGNLTSTTLVDSDVSSSAAIAVSKLAASATDGYVLTTTLGVPVWSSTSASFTAGGDLTGTASNQTVAKIHGATVPIAGSLTTGNGLYVSGASALSYSALNLAGGSGYVTGVLPIANQASQSLSGDLSGTTASGSVVKLQGVAVNSTAPTNNQVLTYDSVDGYWRAATPSAVTSVSVGGDLSGTTASATVIKLQNRSVNSTAPSDADALVWSAVDGYWRPSTKVAPTRLISSGIGLLGGGDLSSDRTLSVSYGNTSTTSCVGNDGRLTDSRTPTGPATGDLSGTYPAPTVAKINAATVPAAGSLTTGNGLYVSGASALSYSALNLAGGSGYVTGVLPTANQASQSLTGDVSGTTAANIVAKIQGKTLASSLSSVGASQDGYVLTWVNGSSDWEAKPPSAPESNLLGDVTGPESATVVSAISGSSPIAITPATLRWVSSASTPTITQAANTISNAATNLAITAQSTTFSPTGATNTGGFLQLQAGSASSSSTANTGGDLTLRAGAGTGGTATNGKIDILDPTNGNNVIQITANSASTTTFAFASGITGINWTHSPTSNGNTSAANHSFAAQSNSSTTLNSTSLGGNFNISAGNATGAAGGTSSNTGGNVIISSGIASGAASNTQGVIALQTAGVPRLTVNPTGTITISSLSTATGLVRTASDGTLSSAVLSVVNNDISAGAAIAVSKLAPSGTNGQVLTTTGGVAAWAAGGFFTPPTGTGACTVTSGALDSVSKAFSGTGNIILDTSATLTSPVLAGSPTISANTITTTNNAKGTSIDRQPVSVQTINTSASTILDSFSLPSNTAVVCTWLVVGTLSTMVSSAAYTITACFKNNTGTVVQVGSTQLTVIGESDSSWNCSITNPSSNTIQLNVFGPSSGTVTWTATATCLQVIP